jgi:asparaginyl-tRNA synthetase
VQVYMPKEVAEAHGGKDVTKTGASLLVRGELTETPPEVQQPVELRATEILHFGPCDPKTYPMAKKKHGMEFLREKAHLRPRTNVIGAVARIRSQLAYATHQFFQSHDFLYVHTPIITASDCEGAGEMFQARPAPWHARDTSTMRRARTPFWAARRLAVCRVEPQSRRH